MALETATYINALVESNPDGGDQQSTADDHLRLLKACLKRTFPNIDGELSASQGLIHAAVRGETTASYAQSAGFASSASSALVASFSGSASFAHSANHAASSSFASSVASVSDGALSSNVPLKNAANAFSAANTFSERTTVGGSLRVQGAYVSTGMTGVHAFLDVDAGTTARVGGVTTGGTLAPFAIAGSSITLNGVNVTDFARKSQATTFLSDLTVSNGASTIFRLQNADNSVNAYAGVGSAAGFIGMASNHPLGIYTNDTLRVTIGADGTFSVTGAATMSSTLVVTGALTASSTLGVTGAATFAADISMTGTRAIDATTRLNLTGATVSVGESGGALGFYGAAGISKPSVAGKINDGTALISLLNQLESLGLITKAWTES